CFVPHPKNQPIVGFANRAEKNRRVSVAATWGAASGAPAASSCVGRRRVISQNANPEIGVPKGLGVEGEGEGKFGALAYCTFYPEFAAMSFDDVFGDAEAEAGAARFAGAGGVHAVEAFEDSFGIGERDADARVGDGDDGFALPGGSGDADVAAGRGGLGGVVEGILQNVAEHGGGTAHGGG